VHAFGFCGLPYHLCGVLDGRGRALDIQRLRGPTKGQESCKSKRIASDVAEACMSARVDKISASIASKATPVVNSISTAHTVYQFGSCALRCGR